MPTERHRLFSNNNDGYNVVECSSISVITECN